MSRQRRQRNFVRFNAFLLCVMLGLLILSYREDWSALYRETVSSTSEGVESEAESADAETESSGTAEEQEEWPELRVHFIDVGQADCTLFELEGQFLLVDAGNEGDEAGISDYLNRHGAYELQYVIGTHPHEDHIGSMDIVISQYDVREVLLPDVIADTVCYRNMKEAMTQKNLTSTSPEVGAVYEFGRATFQILGPKEREDDNLNNHSIAFKMTYGETTFLLAGDAEQEEEWEICESGLDISADVLKVNHHGSSSSSSEEFLQMVHPEYAVISCGLGNEYGHPTAQTLDRLKEHQVSVFRTDFQGDILAVSDGKEILWNMEPMK